MSSSNALTTENTKPNWVGMTLLVVACSLLVWLAPFAAVIAVLVLIFILFMHELGHFLTARLTGMRATELFLGFGPRIWSMNRKNVEYGIKAIPAGAYVRIIGLTSDEKVKPELEKDTYRAKSFPRRVLVITAGSLMHFLMAFVALIAINFFFKHPQINEPQWEISHVETTLSTGVAGPAATAGILEKDQVLSVDGSSTTNWGDFFNAVSSKPGQTTTFKVLRNGNIELLDVNIGRRPGAENIGYVGVQNSRIYTMGNPVAAVITSIKDVSNVFWLSLNSIGAIAVNIVDITKQIFTLPNNPSANENLEKRPISVVGIVQIGSNSILNFRDQIALFAIFNVFLGVFNLLPVLPLDGGYLTVACYERLREYKTKKRHMANTKKLLPLTYIVFGFLIFLGLGTIYLDISNPIQL